MPKSIKGGRSAGTASPMPQHKKSSILKANVASPNRPPSSSSRTSPASPSFPSVSSTQPSRDESSIGESEADSSSGPIFGSTSTFRSNFMRSVRDKSGPGGREETVESGRTADEKPYKSNSSSSGMRDGLFNRSRGQNSTASSSSGGKAGPSRKANGLSDRGGTQSPSTEDAGLGDGEVWKEKRRGSMIKNLGQRAKGVLPMKRTIREQPSRDESNQNLAVKSSSSVSSLHSSQSGDGQTRYNDTTSESDETAEEQEDDETLKGRVKALDSHQAFSNSAKDLKLPFQSPTDEMPSTIGESPLGHANGKAFLRPKSVPTRSSSSDVVPQMGQGDGRASVVKRSNKIMQISPEDFQEIHFSETPVAGIAAGSFTASEASGSALHQTSKATLSTGSLNAKEGSNASDTKRSFPSSSSPQVNGFSSSKSIRPSASAASLDMVNQSRTRSGSQPQNGVRPGAPRSTSAIKASSTSSGSSHPRPQPSKASLISRTPNKIPTTEPPIPNLETLPKAEIAPPNGMYWSKAPSFGEEPSALRAHTATLVGSNVFVFGGCDAKVCFNDLYVFDADCMAWSHPECSGEIPPPLRAMTTTAVGKKLVIFGGGDGPSYYNDVYVLDTINFRYFKPEISSHAIPSKRRAHTACLHKNGIYVFGGGDGVRALNDVWRLDVSDLNKPSWTLISPSTSGSKFAGLPSNGEGRTINQRPTARGYHTANMVSSKLIIFGGSDGVECFRDVWVFDIETLVWRLVDIKVSFPRLSHSSTIVGSYLFVIGGHDGTEYSCDVLLLNLVTMQWDRRKVYGAPPSGRGYHGAVLHDSRLFVIGGFDGHTVFDDTFILELAVSAYYSQISHFTIDV